MRARQSDLFRLSICANSEQKRRTVVAATGAYFADFLAPTVVANANATTVGVATFQQN